MIIKNRKSRPLCIHGIYVKENVYDDSPYIHDIVEDKTTLTKLMNIEWGRLGHEPNRACRMTVYEEKRALKQTHIKLSEIYTYWIDITETTAAGVQHDLIELVPDMHTVPDRNRLELTEITHVISEIYDMPATGTINGHVYQGRYVEGLLAVK